MADESTGGGISPIGAISNAVGSIFNFLNTNKQQDLLYDQYLYSNGPDGQIWVQKDGVQEDNTAQNNLIIIGILALTLVGIVVAISMKRKNN